MKNKRVSNRRYPPKKCPQCQRNYIPTSKRQIYCVPQCRIDFNNDKRNRDDAQSVSFTKALKINRKSLKKGFEKLEKHQEQYLNLEFLKYDGFNPAIYSDQSIEKGNGNMILWSLDYGIEGIDKQRTIIKIHKRFQ